MIIRQFVFDKHFSGRPLSAVSDKSDRGIMYVIKATNALFLQCFIFIYFDFTVVLSSYDFFEFMPLLDERVASMESL